MTKTYKKLKYSGGFLGMNNKKVFKVILCAMLVLALVISNFAGLDLGFVKTYAQEPVTMQGSGSEGDPYQITNYAQLKEFAGIVNGGQTGACAKLMNDIVCTDKLWVPIGNANNKYNGHFNDNNEEIKKIIGLNNTGFNDVNDGYQGLFGCIGSNGIVKNIGIEGGEIKGKDFIGGVAGRNEGTITNCYNTGSISGSGDSADVGGVAGYNGGTITNCYNTGSISGGENAWVGGVAGENWGDITNCYNTGSISGSGAAIYVGGVAGYNYGTITNCYNTGLISAGGANARVGGVAGVNFGGTITYCYYDSNRSNVSNAIGNQDNSNTVKGLTTDKMTGSNADQNMEFAFGPDEVNPWLYQENDDNNYFYPHLNGVNFTKKTGIPEDHVVDNSIVPVKDWPARILSGSENGGSQNNPYEISDYNMLKQFSDIVNGTNGYTSNISACAILTNDIICTDKLWVPIGYYNSYTDNAFYSGQFDGNIKKIIGLNNTGFEDVDDRKNQGLFGYISSNGTVKNIGVEGGEIKGKSYIGGVAGYNFGIIINCYNTGSISGGDGAFVGGVAGYNYEGTITNCYNTGSINSIDNARVGGIAGSNYGTITNCYNTGSISGRDNANVGGVAGENDGTITNCYNTGSISGRDNVNVGGVAGRNNRRVTITNSYNTGSISGGDNANVGGVAGVNDGIITNCYNTGSISGGSIVGGVTGYNASTGNNNNCYYNKDILGDIKGINVADTNAVKGLTTAEMTGMSYDVKMQFVYDVPSKNPWIIKVDEVTDNSFKWYYPHLKGFEFDNEGIVISNPAEITNWPAYVEMTVSYTEPESYVYNGSALYPELMLKVGDNSYPENANVNYYVLEIDGSWKNISDEPDEPGTY
ncbi:MAG: hypothetical protein IJL55_10125, partial [Lachnospiraceae bacterium]|nr:hypothetical protein [Lachnospiraceae bacterium]